MQRQKSAGFIVAFQNESEGTDQNTLVVFWARRIRETRPYGGNINSKFLEDTRPSSQGSR